MEDVYTRIPSIGKKRFARIGWMQAPDKGSLDVYIFVENIHKYISRLYPDEQLYKKRRKRNQS